MTKDNLKPVILECINHSTGIRGVELALAVLNKTLPYHFETADYHEALEELVKEAKVVEVEYYLPDMPDRTKSIFFPAGTSIEV